MPHRDSDIVEGGRGPAPEENAAAGPVTGTSSESGGQRPVGGLRRAEMQNATGGPASSTVAIDRNRDQPGKDPETLQTAREQPFRAQSAPATADDTLGHGSGSYVVTEKLEVILKKHRGEAGALIPVFQELQKIRGYLPKEDLAYIARALGRPLSEVFGVASFYAQFYLEPRGERMVRVCLGTACHVRGADKILEAFAETMGIQPGETTPDKRFSLEMVACLGACGLAPVVMIDVETHGRLTPESVPELFEKIAARTVPPREQKDPDTHPDQEEDIAGRRVVAGGFPAGTIS